MVDAQHTTVDTTGTGAVDDPATDDADEADPVMFPTTDPMATDDNVLKASNITGVPRLDAMGNPFVDSDNNGISDGGENTEDEDDNPNANGAAGDKLRSIENLTGSNHADYLTGDTNPNVLKGMGGNDVLVGGDEDETGDVGDKLYGGDGDDDLSGGGGEDMLNGGAGDDDLAGGNDNDTLTGGAGNDDLSGGDGADTFVFSTADAGDSDVILDFDPTENDKLDLSAFGLTDEELLEAIEYRGDPEAESERWLRCH